MLIIILILIFGSIAAISYEFAPAVLERYSQAQSKRSEKAHKELHKMFIFTENRRLVSAFTVMPVLFAVCGFILLHSIWGALVGGGIGWIMPYLWIKAMAKKRRNDFSNQMVDAFMLLSSSLKAGMSLTQSFEVLTEELQAPISEEFALVLKENKMGVPLEDCLMHLKNRMHLDDLDLFTTAVNIARETGGDLTEIFMHLVYTIREKRKLDNRVRTLTVQGRLQGAIMGLLPIAFGTFIYFINPEGFNIMLSDKVGQMLLCWAVVSEIIGVILIRKLSKVEL